MKSFKQVMWGITILVGLALGVRADNLPHENRSPEVRIGGVENTAYEELYEFSDSSKYRKAGASVGHLVVEFANKRYGVVIRGTCTATLLHYSLIITASHCLKDDEDPNNPVRSLVLWMGFDDQIDRAAAYQVSLTPVENDEKLDYTILRVDGDPSGTFGIALLASKKPLSGEELFVIHHPNAKRKQLTRRLCRVRQIADAQVRYNCHTAPGSSGGPLFSDNDPAVRLIAIHTGPRTFMNETLNEGTLITEIAKTSCVVGKIIQGAPADTCGAAASSAQAIQATGGVEQ